MRCPEFNLNGDASWPVLALLAVGVPALVAYNVPPSATFFNQDAAYIGWGAYLLAMAAALPAGVRPRSRGAAMALAALGLLLVASLTAPFRAGLPWALAWSNAGTLAAAALVLCLAATIATARHGPTAFNAFCLSVVVAGLISAAIGLVQVYAPQWTDGTWVSHTSIAGRAAGNVRQPNHLSSLLLWSIVAAIWLGERSSRRNPKPGSKVEVDAAATLRAQSQAPPWLCAALLAIAALFLFVIVLSASRTGALGTLTLAAWGLLDRRLSRPARVALLLAPLAYALMWQGASAWAQHTGSVFVGETRFTATENISSSRFAIWSDTLALIRAHPWFGVGFGEFNFAWTLTPFPNRPTEFFDHAHNLPLHFAAELGVPLALLVLGLLAWALLQATQNALRAGRDPGASHAPMERAALVIVLMVCVHSLLEYPLWYSYFLLPTVFALGLCLGGPRPVVATADHARVRDPRGDATALGVTDALQTGAQRTVGPVEAPMPSHRSRTAAAEPPAPAAPRRQPTRPLVVASMFLVLGGVLALYDYMRVVVIFAPPAGAAPLAERIDAGRRSVLFAHHGDYAAATIARRPSEVMSAFDGATHYLLDARLMMAWARALDEAGDTDRARHIAARLREFRNEQTAAFFAVCAAPPPPDVPPPFQCEPPTRAYGFDDFR